MKSSFARYPEPTWHFGPRLLEDTGLPQIISRLPTCQGADDEYILVCVLPAIAGNATIDEYFNLTCAIIISAKQRELVRDPSYAAYAAKHGGRLPAIDPVPIIRWNFTQNVTDDVISLEYWKRQLFEDWYGSNVLVRNNETCSNALLVYLGNNTDPNPCNRYLCTPGIPFGFDATRPSSYSGAPDFVLPLGVTPYHSTITGKTEYLPISVDIMAAKGCDGLLFALVQDLAKANILSPVLPGYSPTEGRETLML